MTSRHALRGALARWVAVQRSLRPDWASLLALGCGAMALVWIPLDLLTTPVVSDEQVWVGITLRGWGAKIATVPHLLIYGAGAYGFWRLAPWMWPWAPVYAVQVAVAMAVWGVRNLDGPEGTLIAGACALPFVGLAWGLAMERERFVPPAIDLATRYGGWALVTGASSGIGEAFARAFARAGLPVIMTARRQDRLEELALELSGAHGVEIRSVALDLAEPGASERLADAIADIEIGVLVANAGVGAAGRFERQDTERLRAMIELNCTAPVVLASRMVPALRRRGRGAVIVTGSVAGRQPVPLHGVYAATKAFDLHFGEMLWAELLGSGVDVLVIEPGPTDTEFQLAAGEHPHAGEAPARVVETALAALGRQPSVVSGWANWLRAGAARILPRALAPLLAGSVMAQWTPASEH